MTEPSEKRLLVDQVMREFLLEKLTDKPDTWTSFLDLSIAMARLEICSPTPAIALLTDLVEVSSLDDCSIVFDFIESRLDVWKDPLLLLSGKNAVLRMCNAPAATSSSANATEEETNDKSGKNGTDELSAPTEDLKSKKKKKPRRQIGDSIKDASEKNTILLGHTELTRLWNICPDNLEACRMKSRDFMPQLDAFFSEAFKEMEKEPTSLSVLMDSSKKDFKPKKY
ncbi:unnamed protein product [Orchesella dallaii]|uniref:Uncharacterized protein n=1 Tax=Orchesella dallaii TaxID=48710 RepID=A0ABP1QVW7_9HEXA